MADTQTLEELEARRQTYAFLASLYMDAMGAEFLANLKAAQPEVEGLFGQFVAQLAEGDLEQIRIDTAAEYNALLLNMSRSPVFPYESVYTSELHLMRQDAYEQVKAFMGRLGLAASEKVNLPEDHIGIELEFMGRLVAREVDALVMGDDAARAEARDMQREFLRDHLLVWAPQFCADLAAKAKSFAYRGLAEMTEDFLAFEAEDFGLDLPE